MADKLTPKQEKFVQGLFAGLSQREAYKRAYNCENMKDETIDKKACELAKQGKIRGRLTELQDELKERNMVTVEKVLTELAKVGFANGIEVKTNDKLKALELMGKYLGMFKDNVNIMGAVPVQIVDDIDEED